MNACLHEAIVRKTGKCAACGQVPKQPVNLLALRIYNAHAFLIRLGPRMGGPFVRALAYYSLYRIFTNGGAESLAYIAHEYMIREGEKLRQQKKGIK